MGKKSKNKEKEKLTGGWESIHAAVWLLGLAVIAWQGWWWPGILVLVAFSTLFEAFIKKAIPDSYVTVKKDETGDYVPVTETLNRAQPASVSSQPAHRSDLLPTNCPRCGGPTRGHEVIWTGEQSADCPFCGANLPMKSA